MAGYSGTRRWDVEYYTRDIATKAPVLGGPGILTIDPNGNGTLQDKSGVVITKGVWYGQLPSCDLVIGDKILKILNKAEDDNSQEAIPPRAHASCKKIKPAQEPETEAAREQRQKDEAEQKEWEASVALHLEQQREKMQAEQVELDRIENLSPKSKIRAKMLRHKFRTK